MTRDIALLSFSALPASIQLSDGLLSFLMELVPGLRSYACPPTPCMLHGSC